MVDSFTLEAFDPDDSAMGISDDLASGGGLGFGVPGLSAEITAGLQMEATLGAKMDLVMPWKIDVVINPIAWIPSVATPGSYLAMVGSALAQAKTEYTVGNVYEYLWGNTESVKWGNTTETVNGDTESFTYGNKNELFEGNVTETQTGFKYSVHGAAASTNVWSQVASLNAAFGYLENASTLFAIGEIGETTINYGNKYEYVYGQITEILSQSTVEITATSSPSYAIHSTPTNYGKLITNMFAAQTSNIGTNTDNIATYQGNIGSYTLTVNSANPTLVAGISATSQALIDIGTLKLELWNEACVALGSSAQAGDMPSIPPPIVPPAAAPAQFNFVTGYTEATSVSKTVNVTGGYKIIATAGLIIGGPSVNIQGVLSLGNPFTGVVSNVLASVTSLNAGIQSALAQIEENAAAAEEAAGEAQATADAALAAAKKAQVTADSKVGKLW